MSQIQPDLHADEQAAVTSLIESYLFDFPDHPSLIRAAVTSWPEAVLTHTHLQWGTQRGSLLHKACEDGRLLWVNALLDREADPWAAAEGDGLPAAGWAARGQQTACLLRVLAVPGACPNPRPRDATTLFHVMMGQADDAAVEAWLAWWQVHGDPLCVPLFDRPDEHGLHPTHLLADRPQPARGWLDRLMGLGFSAAARDPAGRTPQERLASRHPLRVPSAPAPVALGTRRFSRRAAVAAR